MARTSRLSEARMYISSIVTLEDNAILSPSEAKNARERVLKMFRVARAERARKAPSTPGQYEKLRDAEEALACIEKESERKGHEEGLSAIARGDFIDLPTLKHELGPPHRKPGT